MWSRFLRLKISLAAVFCTRCSGSTVDCGRPARTELQLTMYLFLPVSSLIGCMHCCSI